MSYETALEMLGDRTRRAIVERLRTGPATPGAIAADLPVSRPAVSKHLRLMREAGLVDVDADGTRNVYRLRTRGLDDLRRYIDTFWDEPLERFKRAAERSAT